MPSMLPQDCLRAYRNNSVLTASPGQLVLMLYDGALRSLESAMEGFGRPSNDWRRIDVISNGLLKAQAILRELRSNLDHEAGGEVTKSLDQLYDYYLRRLEEASLRMDVKGVEEVQRLLKDLRDGWAEMLTKGQPSAPAGMRPPA